MFHQLGSAEIEVVIAGDERIVGEQIQVMNQRAAVVQSRLIGALEQIAAVDQKDMIPAARRCALSFDHGSQARDSGSPAAVRLRMNVGRLNHRQLDGSGGTEQRCAEQQCGKQGFQQVMLPH